ncbi:hypothetical protein H072_3037 [Dactylellina haptotyla CBS 200.50]|uniref:Partial AB-hydrolase lipase domain-containing protein n=1 Tax=Dactylellina haptotyla (strain CBS 200.50) TaxID=1284197 RepID=S8APC4_DACHA|nr:hypothetical protein H072_3037 [Dactylellina haptotyla CBS 200.50]
MPPAELPASGASTSSNSLKTTTTQQQLHPSVETKGLPLTNNSNFANVGLIAKVVAGNEKVLETSSGLRLPCDPAVLEDVRADATITTSFSPAQLRSPAHIPARTNAQFPPLPIYGSSAWPRRILIQFFKLVSFVLSTAFLLTIVCGAVFRTLQLSFYVLTRSFRHKPDRPLRSLEHQLDREIDEQERKHGKAQLKCDVGYYARRVGLDVEEFKVTTEDGFILVLQHVFDPKDKGIGAGGRKRKYPVLLIHGLLQSSGAFCSNDDNSLAFYLCKSGYDVWLGNNRCYYKPEHMVLKSSDPRMWCWNIRQMGIFDLPAFVDHILSRTGFDKLALVAHSQGTTQSFVAMAKDQHPTLASKISIFCALAPAVYAGPLIKLAHFKFMKLIPAGMFRTVFGIHSFIPFMITMHRIVPGRLYGWLGYRVFTYLFSWSDVLWSRRQRSRGFMFSPVYVSSESMRWWLGRDGFATHKCILATRSEVEEEERMEGFLTATARGPDGQEHRMESKAVATTRPIVGEGEEKIEAKTQLSMRTETMERSPNGYPITSEIEEEWHEKTTKVDLSPCSERKEAPLDYAPSMSTGNANCEKRSALDSSHSGETTPSKPQEKQSPPLDEAPRSSSEERRERAWFNDTFPPLALWICGSDKLVDGMKLLNRLDRGAEPDVKLVHAKVIPAYEHLDCIWAIDSIQQVGSEVKTCIWRSIAMEVRKNKEVQVPVGCEGAGVFEALQ